MRLREAPLDRPLAAILSEPPGEAIRLFWLGQAGFVVDGAGRRVVIDPYLSDALEARYRGTATPHDRMMPPPLPPGGIGHVDLVLSTHAHTDHLDADTLGPLLAANPGAVMVAAAAEADKARTRSGLHGARLVLADAGQRLAPCPGIELSVTRAAHEVLQRDARGRHVFLGYAVHLAGATIFHSGDTIPFAGQAEEVAALAPDLALFPVNGRDAARASRGIPGNMTAKEARALAGAAGIPAVIAHHVDMFAFNTVPRATLDAQAREAGPVAFHPARTDVGYVLDADGGAPEKVGR